MKLSRRKLVLALALTPIVARLGCAPRRHSGPIVIGVRTSNCQAPFYVADRRQLYAQRGQEVVVRLVPSNTEIIEAMQRGDFQMGSLPITTAIAAIAHGAPLHIVAITGRGSDGLLVRRADGPKELAGIKGGKVATIRASILDVLLQDALQHAGMDPRRDIEMVYMSKLGDMISALKTGQVMATSNTEPFMTDAERQGWGRILTYYSAYWPDHPCCVVVAEDTFARQEPQALQDILAAHREAVDWAHEHAHETAEILCDTLQAFDADLVAETLVPPKMRLDYHLLDDEVERMAVLMQRQGLIERAPDRARLVDDGALRAILQK